MEQMVTDRIALMKKHSRESEQEKGIPLFGLKAGKWVRILSLPHGTLRAQFIRVGIHEGERVHCIERLPGGTIVLQRNRQQIAIGHQLAKQISVVVLPDEKSIR